MNEKMIKKVSFRVRRNYYDQYVNNTKTEELRALTPYWIKILQPPIPMWMYDMEHPLLDLLCIYQDNQPKIATINTPGLPRLEYKIAEIYIDFPEKMLGRELSEQDKKDIPTELCIATRLGDRIQ